MFDVYLDCCVFDIQFNHLKWTWYMPEQCMCPPLKWIIIKIIKSFGSDSNQIIIHGIDWQT